ncbi:MAG: preprotein translocase subunit SecG [Alphaproteobacteria bacterium]
MQPIILVIHLVLAIALVVVILMQRSEGGAANLTGGGGGGMGGFMSVRGAGNFLTKLTTYLAMAFIATSLILAVFAGSDAGPASIMEEAAPMVPTEDAIIDEPVEPAVPSVPLSE